MNNYREALHQWQEARKRFNEASSQAEIDAAIYELMAAEIRLGEAHSKAKVAA